MPRLSGQVEPWWTTCTRLDTHPERIPELLDELHASPHPVALDLETVGCNPKVQSPVGNAKPWCMTLAWGEAGAGYRTAFVKAAAGHPNGFCKAIRTWLSSSAPKVGANVFNFDVHALKNIGISFNGIVGDTVRMSRLLNPDAYDHDLKSWGKQLGWEVQSLEEVSSRPKPGALVKRSPKAINKQPSFIWGGTNPEEWGYDYTWMSQNIQWSKTELIPIDQLWELYPSRREALVKYAVRDAAMALDVYWFLRRQLEGLNWEANHEKSQSR